LPRTRNEATMAIGLWREKYQISDIRYQIAGTPDSWDEPKTSVS